MTIDKFSKNSNSQHQPQPNPPTPQKYVLTGPKLALLGASQPGDLAAKSPAFFPSTDHRTSQTPHKTPSNSPIALAHKTNPDITSPTPKQQKNKHRQNR